MTEEKLIDLARVGMGIHSPNDPEYIVCEALIKALARRTWVGLTDEDRLEFAKAQYSWEDLLIAAEAKLKAKNT